MTSKRNSRTKVTNFIFPTLFILSFAPLLAQSDSALTEITRLKETLNQYSAKMNLAENRNEIMLQKTTYNSLIALLFSQHEMLDKANKEIEDIRKRLLKSDHSASSKTSDVIYFRIGAVALTESGIDEIKRFVEANGATKEYIINGFADQTGSDKSNQWLSKRRALSVKEYLVSDLKLNEKNITINYYGSEKKVCETNDASCNSQNRRVEMYVKVH